MILYTFTLSICLYYLLTISNNCIFITKSTLVCWIHDIDILNMIRTHLGAGGHDVVHLGNAPKWYTASCPPDKSVSFISLLFILPVCLA